MSVYVYIYVYILALLPELQGMLVHTRHTL